MLKAVMKATQTPLELGEPAHKTSAGSAIHNDLSSLFTYTYTL